MQMQPIRVYGVSVQLMKGTIQAYNGQSQILQEVLGRFIKLKYFVIDHLGVEFKHGCI